MADITDQAHYDAFMAFLRADVALTVYPDPEGFTPIEAPDRYVRVFGFIDRPAEAGGNSLAGTSQQWTTRLYCHCVGPNEYAAAAVAMRVRAAVLDKRPTVAGRDCGLIREDQALPPVRDTATGADSFDATCVYRFRTN